MLFAANESGPRMINLPYERSPLYPSVDVIQPPRNFSRLFDFGARPMHVQTLYPSSQALPDGRSLEVYINDNFSNDGSPTNQAVRALTEGKAFREWADHIVVLRKKSVYDEG